MIAPDTLARIVAEVESRGPGEATVAALRGTFPDLHFTACSEDDVPARLTPVAQGPGYALHLVSGATHCVNFTTQPEAATGLVLASVEESD